MHGFFLVEEILKLFEGNVVFTLDSSGNFTEVSGLDAGDLTGESFLSIVSEEDRKKAATLFLEVMKEGHAQDVLRLKTDDVYKIFEFRVMKKDGCIYGVAREIKREEPSFITDFLGNVVQVGEGWDELTGTNIFDMVEGKSRLMDIVKTAIEQGEYEGTIVINEKESKLRIKATQWLEFFIEDDYYKLLEEIFDARDARDIMLKTRETLEALKVDFSLRIHDEKYGEENKHVLYMYPIYRSGEVIGEINVYQEMDKVTQHMVKMVSLAASKAMERMEDLGEILQDVALYKIDAGRKLVYANRKFEEMLGYSLDEIKNRELAEFVENRERFFEELERGTVENFVSRWKGKDRDIIASESARRINGETVVILTDITRQKEQEDEAEFYNSVLRHDIFNKNEIALGYMGLLEKTNLTKKQRELIEKIKDSIHDSNELITNVRKLSEIRRAGRKLIPVNIKKVVKEVCTSHKEMTDKCGIELSCTVEPATVEADEFVGEIFSNLIKNAVEHAGCTTITIRGTVENSYYAISVADNGKGVDKKDLDKLFEKGWKKGGSGSGLGLYIVKQLVKRYGGRVEAKSENGLKITLYFKIAGKRKKAPLMKIRI